MVVGERVVSSDSCGNDLCNVTISLDVEENGIYYVSIVASNGVEQSNRNVTSTKIGELLLQYLITLQYVMSTSLCWTASSIVSLIHARIVSDGCSTFVHCSLPEGFNGSCSIEYGQDPSYRDLSPPIQTPINSTTTLPLLEPSTMYYSLITVTINSTLPIQISGTFNSGSCECLY